MAVAVLVFEVELYSLPEHAWCAQKSFNSIMTVSRHATPMPGLHIPLCWIHPQHLLQISVQLRVFFADVLAGESNFTNSGGFLP